MKHTKNNDSNQNRLKTALLSELTKHQASKMIIITEVST